MTILSVLPLFKYSNGELFFIFTAVLMLIDLTIFFALKYFLTNNFVQKIWLLTHFFTSIFIYGIIFYALLFITWEPNPYSFDKVYYLSGAIFTLYAAKCTLAATLLLQIWLPKKYRKTAVNIAFVTSFIVLLSLTYGMLWGRFVVETTRHDIAFKQLPVSFEGFKIVQISDLHLGIFPGFEHEFEKIIDGVNAQNPDMVVITGDLINSFSAEIEPFSGVLKQIKAPYGVFAVTGNHDYGDYYRWGSDSLKLADFVKFKGLMAQSGICLLNNCSRPIVKDGDTLYVAGIENWGLPPYRQEGNLGVVAAQVPEKAFCILLSHDPIVWENVCQNFKSVALTLSGHTHGMQIGIKIFGFEFSPFAIHKKYLKGWYKNGDQLLYINKGIGGALYPGRVGMTPEISVFQLLRAK